MEDVRINGEKSTVETQRKDLADKAIYALVAKTDPEKESLWLPLIFHLKDTAAVMEYLVTDWLPEKYHENLGLNRKDFLQLAMAAAMFHDVGKSIKLFQWRITENRPELREQLRRSGLPMQSFTTAENPPHAAAGAELLRLEGYNEGLAAVVGAHHGKPESCENTYFYEQSPLSFGWSDTGDQNTEWGRVQKALIQWAAEQLEVEDPGEWPSCQMIAQMALTGLVIMADWIASNTAYFPLISIGEQPRSYEAGRAARALQKLHLPKPWKVSEDWKDEEYFRRRFGFEANCIQKRTMQLAERMETPGVMILEAPMGQGKTEAALAAAEVLMNRFDLSGAAFFLPSQATSNAMFSRMTRWAERQPDAIKVAVELAHGQAEFNEEFAMLEKGSVSVEQGEADAEPLMVHSFFRGRKTKLLANLVVGTVDQLLMAALRQKHVMLRHLGLTGKVVIIDECHAYDAYMNTYLDCALNWLGAYKVPVILLSATLPGARRSELLQSYLGRPANRRIKSEKEAAYPLLSWTSGQDVHTDWIPPEGASRRVTVERTDEEAAVGEIGRALEYGSVGIIVNTVKRAQKWRELLKEKYPEAVILLDHSRFLTPDWLEHEKEILERVGKKASGEVRKGVLVIGTQVLEQSLDLDFDLLVTDLCPMDLLLQRIGRLHRHARMRPQKLEEARCLVMGAQGELESGSRAVYGDYLLMRTRDLLPDVIHLPEDISPLVQKTYEEALWSPQPSEQYSKAKEDYEIAKKKQQQNARSYRLDPPVCNEFLDSIVGLLDEMPGMTELQARAAVRDGCAPLEVLAVQKTEEGGVRILSGEQKGLQYRTDTQPSEEEARIIAAQRLRLPSYFGNSYCVDSVIKELEAQTKQVPLWRQAPLLEGELFLIFDTDGKTRLAGKQLQYNSQVGLTEEEEDGTNRV